MKQAIQNKPIEFTIKFQTNDFFFSGVVPSVRYKEDVSSSHSKTVSGPQQAER